MTSVDDAVQMLSDWQDFHLDKANVGYPLFNRLTVEPWLFVDMMKEKGWKRKVYVTVYFYGTAKHREEFCSKYLPKLEELFVGPEKGEITNWQERTAVGFHRHLAGVKSNKELSSGKHGYALHGPWKGYSAVASKAVSKNSFRMLAEGILESQPLTKRYVEIKSLGGAVKQLDKSETAFWHRDALWWSLSNHFFPKDVEMDSVHIHSLKNKSRRNHEKFIDAMGNSFSGYYAGYIDRSSSSNSSTRDRNFELYYGNNAHRVRDIKFGRDPNNLFRIYVPEALPHASHM